MMWIVALLILAGGCGWSPKGYTRRVRVQRLRRALLVWVLVFGAAFALGYDQILDNLFLVILIFFNVILAIPVALALLANWMNSRY